MKPIILGNLLLIAMNAYARSAVGAVPEMKNVNAFPDGNEVRIEVELTAPVTPIVRELRNPNRLIIDFPKSSVGNQSEWLEMNRNGVYEVHVGGRTGNPPNARIVVAIDSERPYAIHAIGNTVVLSILPHPATAATP